MPSLQKIVDGQQLESIQLSRGITMIGRTDRCQLQIMSRYVSKEHVKISCSDSECVLEDVSTNGTVINGRRLSKEQHALKHGDAILVGPVTFIYLVTESPEDLSGTNSARPKVAVLAGGAHDPDESMKRKAVRAGDVIRPEDLRTESPLNPNKIVNRFSLSELPLMQLTAVDAVRRLSQALRCAELLAVDASAARLPPLLQLMHELYPSADQIAVIRITIPSEPWVVMATSCRKGGSRVMLCNPLIRYVAEQCMAVLATDQWRENDTEAPKLSDLNRCSAICVPLRGQGGQCLGLMQMTASATSPPFRVEDLERLAVLAQVLTLSICRVADVMLRDVETLITSGSAGSRK